MPDRRPRTLPDRFRELVATDLPIEAAEVDRLRAFAPRFEALCGELARTPTPASIQHDDLHLRSAYVDGPNLRVLDWGDASVAHPFASLVVTFRFLEDHNGLAPDDPWFDRLRDAYLGPWGTGKADELELALRVGMVAQLLAWQRHRAVMGPADRAAFDEHFSGTLRRVLARVVNPAS